MDFPLNFSFKKIFRITAALLLAISFVALSVPTEVFAETVEEKEARLKAELLQVEREIAAQQKILSVKQKESVSLERDIAILTAQINEAKLKIRAHNITIERLSKDINVKSATIDELSGKIEASRLSLSQLVRKTNEMDDYSMVAVVLDSRNISEFFQDLDSFDTVKRSLHNLVSEVTEVKNMTEEEKQVLGEKKSQESEARRQIELQKNKIEVKEDEKQRLLSLSRTEEKNYEKVIKERETRAAQIRSALFALRDTSAIPFGTALQYANEAYKRTGVRPAFILAILKQESNLGENVGSCYLTNSTTGHGKKISTGESIPKVMNPERDVPPYLKIVGDLGRDPYSTRLSCPWQVGWGGAMGPSQFIPSTWISYQERIRSLVGTSPDPWNPQHAFIASSLFLKDLGADAGTYDAEREAALRYYAGGYWYLDRNAFYGNQVMAKAAELQKDIDILQGI